MKKIAIFCALLVSFVFNSDAATPRNPRAQSSGAASGDTTTSTTRTQTARSATTTRSASATRSSVAGAAPARAATAGRTTVSRAPTASTSTNNTTARSATVAARAGSTQRVITTGTTVAAANENIVVSASCRDKYYGCMDSFCMLDNDNGGRCICSDKNAEYDSILAQIEELDQQSYQMATYGVERIEMGDAAETAIANANAVAQSILDNTAKQEQGRSLNLDSWFTPVGAEDEFADDIALFQSPVDGYEGDALFAASHQICAEQIPDCSNELDMLQLMYAQQIRSDCSAYENSLKQQKNASAQKLYAAEQALRDAALEQYQTANKYDLGQCTVEFKNCMITTAECGEDFSGCASIAAFDSTNTRGRGDSSKNYTIKGASTEIQIKASTYDILMSKKPLCDTVTKQCQLVADQVWDTFLREVAPQVKSAELIAEDNVRQNCISEISSCFQQACRDTIDPNDPEGSYDMCLTRPETMLSLCTVPLNACGIDSADPEKSNDASAMIWDFVLARLESMRINSCTTQVKECLQSPDRCGQDYTQCIGLDLDSIRQMCPMDLLTSCQQVDSEGNDLITSIEQIENIIQGIYLDIDNSMLDQCQKTVSDKMVELCGGLTTCSAFADDNVIGTESLLSYTDEDGNYVIDGLLSFGNVQINKTSRESENNPNVEYTTYEININDYKNHLNENDPGAARAISALESVSNKIEQKIAILRQDPDIQLCTEGRNMSQVRRGAAYATARFPHLLDSLIMIIVDSGLDQAKQNYTKKYNELVEDALKDQEEQVKSVLCAAMASSSDPQCTEYAVGDNNEAICSAYSAPFVEDIFNSGDDDDENHNSPGLNSDGLYATKYVISGAKLSDLASVYQQGYSEFIQTDGHGNMTGRVSMSSVYSPSTSTCTLTTTTVLCETMKEIILTDQKNKTTCSSLGGGLLGGGGCKGGGGLFGLNLGVSTNSTQITQHFEGVACQSFMDPVTTTTTIKM